MGGREGGANRTLSGTADPERLSGNFVLATDQPARILPCLHMTEMDVARQSAEQRNSVSNQHWHASDREALNESGAQELLDRDPAVDVQVVSTTRAQSRDDLSRSTR